MTHSHKHHKSMGYYTATDSDSNIYFINELSDGNVHWIKLTTTDPLIGSGSPGLDQEENEQELYEEVVDEVASWLIIGTHPAHSPH